MTKILSLGLLICETSALVDLTKQERHTYLINKYRHHYSHQISHDYSYMPIISLIAFVILYLVLLAVIYYWNKEEYKIVKKLKGVPQQEEIVEDFQIKKGYEDVVNSIFEDERRSTLDVSLSEERVAASDKSIYLNSSKGSDEFKPTSDEWLNLFSQQDLLEEDIKLGEYNEYPEDSSSGSDDELFS